jgi:hypothetical protein
MPEYEGDYFEPFCDFCEEEGHSFRSCQMRDDDPEDYEDEDE